MSYLSARSKYWQAMRCHFATGLVDAMQISSLSQNFKAYNVEELMSDVYKSSTRHTLSAARDEIAKYISTLENIHVPKSEAWDAASEALSAGVFPSWLSGDGSLADKTARAIRVLHERIALLGQQVIEERDRRNACVDATRKTSERAEAQVADAQVTTAFWIKRADHHATAAEQCREELDRALDREKGVRAELAQHQHSTYWQERCSTAERERDALRAELAQAKRERDNAVRLDDVNREQSGTWDALCRALWSVDGDWDRGPGCARERAVKWIRDTAQKLKESRASYVDQREQHLRQMSGLQAELAHVKQDNVYRQESCAIAALERMQRVPPIVFKPVEGPRVTDLEVKAVFEKLRVAVTNRPSEAGFSISDVALALREVFDPKVR